MGYRDKFWRIKENVPEIYKNAQINEIDAGIAKRFNEMLILKTQKFRGFYIYGNTGVGKSHIAYALTKIHQWIVVVKSTTITKAIKNTFNFCVDNEDPQYEQIQDDIDFLEDITHFVGLLIIDDIGSAEKDSQAVVDRYFEIIDERSENKRWMSFTSNLNPNELTLKFGKRMVDRMLMGCDVIELVDINRRML